MPDDAAADRKPPPWLALLLLLTFLVYSPSIANGFTYDDMVYVQTNRPAEPPNVMVEELQPIGDYFEREMGYDGFEMRGRGFRPFTVLSYAIVHALTRVEDPAAPRGYRAVAWLQHLLNVLLHVIATWLIYRLIACFTGAGWSALGGAAVFGLQPVHSDVVASIIGRGELLPCVAGMAACLSYARAGSRSGGARTWRLLVAAVLLFVAFGSKESAVAWGVFVPLFAFALDRHGRPELGVGGALRAQAKRLAFVLVPLGLWTWLYVRFLGGLTGTFEVQYEFNPLYYLPFSERLPTAVMVLGYGIAKLGFATMLACDYGLAVFDTDVGYGDWRFLLALGFLVGVLVAGLSLWRRHALFFLAAAALLGFSFVTSNIAVPIETIFGERLMFTPSMGVAFAVAALVPVFGGGRARPIGIALLAVWCAWGVRWAVERSFAWRDNSTLMFADVEHQPRSLSINKSVAVRYKERGDVEKWLHYQNRCLELDPHYIMVLNDMAVHFLGQRDYPRAKEYLDRAVASLGARPRYKTVQGDAVYLNLGRYFLVQGDRAGGKQAMQQSRAYNRRNPHSRAHLLMIAHQERDERAAAELLADFAKFQPTDPMFLLHRGLAAWRKGDHESAARALYECLMQKGMCRNRLDLDAWWACEDALLRIGRAGERVEVLEFMMRLFPDPMRARVKTRLVAALRAILPKAAPTDQDAIRRRIRELGAR